MPAGNPPLPPLITEPGQLSPAVQSLQRQPILGVDTESNSLYVYFERVCMIQISTPQDDLLIDPLAVGDLAALGPLFGNPNVEKVFHAAEYDLICLQRDFGFRFASLFDTMVAARILGYTEVGLGAMLESQFGIQVDKRQQRANWGQRPLPENLLDYARLDTHYLISLRQRLKEALLQKGLWPLAQEDFRRLCSLPADESSGETSEDRHTVDPWRISGSRDLPPQQAAVLMQLCRYRDKIARQIDRPLFKVIGDRTLLRIAQHSPQDLHSLAKIPDMTPGQVQRHGARLVQAVKSGLRASPIYPPRSPRPDQRYLKRLEALRQWRKAAGQRMGVPSDVVLPRDLLYLLAKQESLDAHLLGEVMQEVPWRLEKFGDEILAVVSG